MLVAGATPLRCASAPTAIAIATDVRPTLVSGGSSGASATDGGGIGGERSSGGLHHAISDAPGPRSNSAEADCRNNWPS
jgi:hypothetical protein